MGVDDYREDWEEWAGPGNRQRRPSSREDSGYLEWETLHRSVLMD